MEAITHLGAVLYQEGRVDEALAKVEEALRIDPAYIHTHWDRTRTSSTASGIPPGTVKAAEAFLQVLPNGPDADNVRRLMAEGAGAGRQAWPPSGRRRLRRGVPNCGVGASPRRSFVRLRTE